MIALNHPVPHWPTTIDQAVDRILAKLTETEKAAIRKTPDEDLDVLNFSLDAGIGNECGLWDGNTALLASCGSPDMHPDSASAVIVRALWECLGDDWANRLLPGHPPAMQLSSAPISFVLKQVSHPTDSFLRVSSCPGGP